ncbi:MAG TPA: DNA cytosine methyltransferase [Paludibacter sp.]|nr:DNA cytosine methyltransferase [Paludibacter sp.]
MKKNSYITVTDQFCGAGGSSQGVRNFSNKIGGGVEVKMALNHWKLAIETHNTNFPDTFHDCTDISACDPRRYMSTDILITSPECTNHSLAKGKKRIQSQMDLFNQSILDPSAERSRATMWDVPRFAEYHNYNLIIVENVVDARSWVMWEAWLNAMNLLGYNHKCVYLNSMHAHPTPQSRDRMYVVFWKKGNKAPDLEYKPKAFCGVCEKEVDSIQSWKDSRKQFGKYRQQYNYRCPRCAMIVEPYYYAAFNVIDWSIKSMRIGDRKKELAPNTMARIRYGLEKHGNSDFVVYLDHSKSGHLISGINDPIRTQTTAQVSAIVSMPGMLVKNYGGAFEPKHSSIGLNEKVATITTHDHHGVLGIPVQPFIVEHFGSSTVRSLNSPLGAVMTKDKYGILAPPMIVENFGTSTVRGIDKPIGTITAGGINHGILSSESVNAFLAYYYGNNQASGMTDPIGTIPTKDRVALVMRPTEKVDINDCTYRMLKPSEIKAAMAFDPDYTVCGNGDQQVRQLGNAVTPPAMAWLIERAVKSLM